MLDIVKVAIVLYLFKAFIGSLNLVKIDSEQMSTVIVCVAVAVVGIVLPIVLRRK